MKTYNNLYGKLCSFDNLGIAFRKAKKGKTKKWYVREFEENLEKELLQLKYELENQTYFPKPLKRFVIRDPKTRVIHASNFRDRVVHHAVCNITEPIFDKIFICDSYANRKKKGSSAAIKRFDKFQKKVSRNGKLVKNAKDNNMIIGYVLKADIKHYFNTVDHDILMNILKKKIKDEELLELIRIILANNTKKSNKGMPIGNLTSQLFANIYLNELDYFVKHKLKAKYYLRYVDDFVILHQSKQQLKIWKENINKFLKENLEIELHAEKSRIIPLARGIDFIGFRNFYYYKLLRKRNIRKMQLKIEQYKNKEISYNKILESFQGWQAYARWANTYKLRNKIFDCI